VTSFCICSTQIVIVHTYHITYRYTVIGYLLIKWQCNSVIGYLLIKWQCNSVIGYLLIKWQCNSVIGYLLNCHLNNK
jgi:hypothetical protein